MLLADAADTDKKQLNVKKNATNTIIDVKNTAKLVESEPKEALNKYASKVDEYTALKSNKDSEPKFTPAVDYSEENIEVKDLNLKL